MTHRLPSQVQCTHSMGELREWIDQFIRPVYSGAM